ncbi:hypothetical protein C8R45DRAFT_523687 [Mycena sanguinolenta]|nr:hypothetical protein C8R45DRAFT_523687 [Mycena sanguinolenta]
MMFIDSLTLEQYYRICAWNLKKYQRFDLSTSANVNLRAVSHCSGDPLEDLNAIAFLLSAVTPWSGYWRAVEGGTGEVMSDGWTRFHSGDVFNNTLSVFFSLSSITGWRTWLSQANYIFRHRRIMSNFDEYVLLERMIFVLGISGPKGDPPEGFLFLCPKEDFRIGPSSLRWPGCPAYWSLNPSGTDRLSLEDAMHLGFPSFELTAKAYGYSWDASVYEGLCQFHQAKGFDPYSQNVARHLGYPLYELSSQADLPFPSDGEDFDADVHSDCNSVYTEDYETEYPSTTACGDSDLELDTEFLHTQKNVHDLVSGDGGSEHSWIPNCEDHDVESIKEEMFASSRSFNILLGVQLALILFLGLSWVYDHVAVSIV